MANKLNYRIGSRSNKKPTKAELKQKQENLSRRLANVHHAVWSAVGLSILILLAVAVFGSGSWTENLNLKPTSQQTGQTTAQPQQPTEQQLNCVIEEVGIDRFGELQQGAPPDADETSIIEECLQG